MVAKHVKLAATSAGAHGEGKGQVEAAAQEHLDLPSRRKKKENIPTPVDNRIMANVEPEEVEMLISSPNHTQGNLMMQSEAQNLECRKQGSHDPIMRKSLIPISRYRWKIPPRSTRWRRRMARSYTSMQKNYLFSSYATSQTVWTNSSSNSSRHNSWTGPRGSYCETS